MSRYSLPRKRRQVKLYGKSRYFVYVRALIMRKILRSKDFQCNYGESP